MCSVGDDNFEADDGAKYLPAIDELTFATLCNKCRSNRPCISLRHKDAYCTECFLTVTAHKFKAFLGKHRLVYPNDTVLIAYKEGHECTALIHLIRSGLDLTTPKKLRFKPVVLYIESNYHLDIETRKDILHAIEGQMKLFEFSAYFVSFLTYVQECKLFLENVVQDYTDVPLSNDDGNKLNEILQNKMNKTQQFEFMKQSKRNLLYEAAKHLECRHIFMSDLGNHVAAELLTSVCMGRGKHLPLDVGIYDDRDSEVTIIRPLRHFQVKEAAMYNHFNKIAPVILPKQPHTGSCIQGLLRTFVDNLQANFPATITTIVRTGDKLALDNAIKTNSRCILCKAPTETATTALTSAESTVFSSLLSNLAANQGVSPQQACATTIAMFDMRQSRKYCYACLRLNNITLNKV